MVKRERTHYVNQTMPKEGGGEEIIRVKITETVVWNCPRCNHGKAWKPRGDLVTLYLRKCTRCGYREPLKKSRRS